MATNGPLLEPLDADRLGEPAELLSTPSDTHFLTNTESMSYGKEGKGLNSVTHSERDEKTKRQAELVQKALNDALAATGIHLSDDDTEGLADEGVGEEQNVDHSIKEDCLKKETISHQPVKTKWIEITDKFISASSKLSPGLLIHEPSFNLYDAMSAIEIADPKMDAIVQWRKLPPNYPHSLTEAIHNNQLKLQGHSNTELIGIFDEVLACVMTWLKGHTLAQTVFTCMYLLEPKQLENQVLCSFAMATIRIVYMIKEVMTKGAVFVEDEQQLISVGLNMLTSVDDDTVLGSLKTARDSIQRSLKDCSAKKSSPVETTNESSFPVDSDSRAKETAAAAAVLARINLVRSLFIVFMNLRKRTRESIQASEQELAACLSFLKEVSNTSHMGQELDPSNPLVLGFHPLINQHNLPPSYRAHGIIPRDQAMSMLTRFLHEFHKVYEVGRLNSISDLFLALTNLSSVHSSLSILTRSFISYLCLNNDRAKAFGTKTIEDMVKEELRSLFNPPCLNSRSPVSTTPLVKDLVERFLGHAHLPFVELLRLYCHHRAKQRVLIGRYLDSVCELQHELEVVDQQLNDLTMKIDPQRQHNSAFSSWFVYYITKLFVDYLHLGFEYRLYSCFEYHYIFWYLEYSYGWRQMTIKAAGKQLLLEPQPHTKSKKKSKGKNKVKELPKDKEMEHSKLQIKRMICIGLMRTFEALMLDGDRIPRPNFEFGSEELIFHNRFLPFIGVLSPHPLSYLDYQQLAGIKNYKDTSLNLYDAAFRHFESAKSSVETLQYVDSETEQLSKVIKTNMVIMKLAASGHKGNIKETPELDFSIHKDFPVIRL